MLRKPFRMTIIGLVGLMIVLATVPHLTLIAQDNGEFCVMAFEDRNGNGAQDNGEPFITRGLSAQLSNADGIIIQTALIDTSPTAGRGLICFQAPPAEYTLSITSADFVATTATNLTVPLTAGQNILLEYGGQRVQVEPIATVDPDIIDGETEDERIERAVVAGTGALVSMCATLFIGFILYLIFLRGRGRRQNTNVYYGDPRYATGTGSMPAVRTDTGQFRPPTGTDARTDRHRTISPADGYGKLSADRHG